MRNTTKRQSRRKGLRQVPKRQNGRARIVRGSDNVFADLGFAVPDEELAKAQLVVLIRARIEKLDLTQTQAAARMGIAQPKVSRLLRGDTTNMSSALLVKLLLSLGNDVEIRVKSTHARTGHLYILAC